MISLRTLFFPPMKKPLLQKAPLHWGVMEEFFIAATTELLHGFEWVRFAYYFHTKARRFLNR